MLILDCQKLWRRTQSRTSRRTWWRISHCGSCFYKWLVFTIHMSCMCYPFLRMNAMITRKQMEIVYPWMWPRVTEVQIHRVVGRLHIASFEEVALARLELSSLPLFSYLLLDVWFSFSIWSNAFFYVMFCHKKESLHLGFDLLLLLPLWFWPLPICLLPLFSTIKTSKYDDVICILHSIASFRTLFFT